MVYNHRSRERNSMTTFWNGERNGHFVLNVTGNDQAGKTGAEEPSSGNVEDFHVMYVVCGDLP